MTSSTKSYCVYFRDKGVIRKVMKTPGSNSYYHVRMSEANKRMEALQKAYPDREYWINPTSREVD